jgi:hypothetical protein
LTEPKHEDSFKVVDRRLFSESGELRKDVAEQTDREQNAAAEVAAKAAKATQAAAPAAAKLETSPAAPGVVPQDGDRKSNHSFQMLVDFIARNAAMLLGGYTDPRTNQPLLDLEGAREIIDMLDALRESTRGNLAAEDERLLMDVIGSLKLSFMEISKAAAAAMKEKAQTHP